MKRLLTLEDLEKFYNSKYSVNMKFDSHEEGYQLAVQVPMVFEATQESENPIIKIYKTRAYHVGKNRNGSAVTKAAAEATFDQLAYIPVLANFCSYIDKDGNEIKDFTSHDMTIETLDDSTGEYKVVYQEHQIGCFTADKAYFEEDKENGKTYICANIAIPNEYTDSNQIIARKGGTKTSVEILINKMSYNCEDRCLDLEDITVQGMTCLGLAVDKDGNVKMDDNGNPIAVEEGMQGANISLHDFAKSNNSLFSSITEDENNKLIDTLEKLNATLEKFNINKENLKEGGNAVTKLEELLNKYSKTLEDLTFDVEGLSDEELEAKFAEEFEQESNEDPTSEEDVSDDEGEDAVLENNDVDDADVENEESEDADENDDSEEDTGVTDTEACKKKKHAEENVVRTYEISHEDIRYALYNLIASYEEMDNDYFYIEAVYDNSFAFSSWCTGNIFGQKYTKDGDNVALDGERYALHRELLTDSEYSALNEMRSNYAVITEKLEKYESAELKAQKDAVLSDEAYAEFSETDEFKAIVENVDNYSVDELKTACDLAFAKLVKANRNFSLKTSEVAEKPKSKLSFAFNAENDDEPYGDYFKSINV